MLQLVIDWPPQLHCRLRQRLTCCKLFLIALISTLFLLTFVHWNRVSQNCLFHWIVCFTELFVSLNCSFHWIVCFTELFVSLNRLFHRIVCFTYRSFHLIICLIFSIMNCINWAVVVAQLVERSLPITEVRGSNPVIGKIFILHKRSEWVSKAHSLT